MNQLINATYKSKNKQIQNIPTTAYSSQYYKKDVVKGMNIDS